MSSSLSEADTQTLRKVHAQAAESVAESIRLLPSFLHAFNHHCDHAFPLLDQLQLELNFLRDMTDALKKTRLLSHGSRSCTHPLGDVTITQDKEKEEGGEEKQK